VFGSVSASIEIHLRLASVPPTLPSSVGGSQSTVYGPFYKGFLLWFWPYYSSPIYVGGTLRILCRSSIVMSVYERRPCGPSRPRDWLRTKTSSNLSRPVSLSSLTYHITDFTLFHYRLAEFEENRDERAHPEELAALRMEANTWGLLQALIP